MIKNLAIFLLTICLMSACSDSDTSSGEASSVTLSSSDTDTSDTDTSDDGSAENGECVAGRYEFRTDSDGKKHFDATFNADGTIDYNLNGGPKGTWTLSGSTLSFVGPFGENRSNVEVAYTVTARASDCKITRLAGKSLGGANVTIRRI